MTNAKDRLKRKLVKRRLAKKSKRVLRKQVGIGEYKSSAGITIHFERAAAMESMAQKFIEFKPSGRKLTCVDLFAGCGGLSLGLEYAGFIPIFVNELNRDALGTYLTNRHGYDRLRNKEFHIDDVRRMLEGGYLPRLKRKFKDAYPENNGEVDLLVGGPPCQGFSGIGIRRTFPVWKKHIESNYLFDYMAKVIHELKPRIFLFENVRGLLSARWESRTPPGEIWETIFNTFQGLPDYKVAAQLVFSRYFGVPQNRPRVLLVGLREDIALNNGNGDPRTQAASLGFLPLSEKNPPNLKALLGDLLEDHHHNGGFVGKYPRKPKRGSIQEWFRSPPPQGLGPINWNPENLTEHKYSLHDEQIIEKFNWMLKHRGKELPKRFQTKKFSLRVLPEEWGKEGPTITATSLPDDYVHYAQPRILTVREWARLQTFPDWYQFNGPRTTGGHRRTGNSRKGTTGREVPKYTQIGNAVPVKLAYEVGLHFRKLLIGDEK